MNAPRAAPEVRHGEGGERRAALPALAAYGQASGRERPARAPASAELPEQGLTFVPMYYAGSLPSMIGAPLQ